MPDESRSMYKSVCANCGKSCEVPFKPSGDRPVYCRDCFRERSEGGGGAPKQGGASATSSSPRPSSQGAPRPSDGLSAQVSAMSTKLDRLLALMENASSPAPHASRQTGKKTASKKKMPARKK